MSLIARSAADLLRDLTSRKVSSVELTRAYLDQIQKYDAKIKAFEYDWAKHWRGKLPTIGDYAVTPNEINDKHLILFGDPSSNLTLAQIMPKLPLKWTKETIAIGGASFPAGENLPVLAYPNPLSPSHYVVLNSGHTFHAEDFQGTNALLYPRLGDYAVMRLPAR